ncbi:MAG TPA: DUF2254 family protein, partial [Paracoccaceae bacterium]|nr:DUF2254 family protein [Paracoccaceae bacterium]
RRGPVTDREPHWRDRAGNALRNPWLAVSRLVPARLHHLLEAFWLLPLALAVVGVLGPLILQATDEKHLALLFGGEEPEIDVAGARATLSVVAGGVITITSLVFSLAFVALTITAQQLSPRVLDYVVEERTTQLLIGLSLSTFLFSAITLSFGITGGEVRLAFSAFVALTMAAASLAMVVVFSHRMTRIMRAEDMVSWLGNAFTAAVRRGPRSITEEMMVTDPDEETALDRRMKDAEPVFATTTGYLGAVDYPGLLSWVEENDLRVEILLRENAFVLEGQPVARVAGQDGPPDELAERITDYVNLTERRVIGETPSYQGNSLSEVALRALSPGINDPATARSCANQLYHGLGMLAALAERPRALKGGDGVPRILRARQGIPEFLENDVAPIVEAARDRMTLRHLRELNETLGGIAQRPKELAAIEALAALIAEREVPAEKYLGDIAEEPPSRADEPGDGKTDEG